MDLLGFMKDAGFKASARDIVSRMKWNSSLKKKFAQLNSDDETIEITLDEMVELLESLHHLIIRINKEYVKKLEAEKLEEEDVVVKQPRDTITILPNNGVPVITQNVVCGDNINMATPKTSPNLTQTSTTQTPNLTQTSTQTSKASTQTNSAPDQTSPNVITFDDDEMVKISNV
ncbi:P78/83 [Phthorimaea operculella granulovirus]|uniref:P78/83 n=1 Tax=Phthorimaea operculella granulovirus TaxID=192584 RepID=Q8JS57_9BBAC|nr:P78/83 [Phthorimaea operculella granulovirus]AAM70200.1 P78/83 [Phthorimaea operculella granulovirus]ANY57391.1 P78/83 [Phthorimaea operculella granulovirus]QBH65837.1 P78/83 [Phthorimaea operculella granulovirus]QBH65967.1 P78/83 [Phthorimaea operculella granulovirus]QBH66617.1 P78/83 [Phthorimaea operculella granulovirus]